MKRGLKARKPLLVFVFVVRCLKFWNKTCRHTDPKKKHSWNLAKNMASRLFISANWLWVMRQNQIKAFRHSQWKTNSINWSSTAPCCQRTAENWKLGAGSFLPKYKVLAKETVYSCWDQASNLNSVSKLRGNQRLCFAWILMQMTPTAISVKEGCDIFGGAWLNRMPPGQQLTFSNG